MCHGIWTWIKRSINATPADATLPEDRPEDLPDNGGFFPEHPLS
jgi:hypothetical protein